MAASYELFYKPTCPFCTKVLTFAGRHGIELPLRDISSEPEARETLERVGGKVQVPCLFIDGSPMYESSDIIAYLAKAFGVENGAADDADEAPSCPIF